MNSDKMMQILKSEGVVAIVTMGGDGSYMVNTGNNYMSSHETGIFYPLLAT